MISRQKARELRSMIEKAAVSLTDQEASEAVELTGRYPNDGSLVHAGRRINWKGQLYRAAVDLWATDANDPDHAPTLWEKVMYRDGIRIIPEVITAGQAFSLGERGWWGDDLYESLIAANVYTPAQYPAGWQKVGP